MLWHETKYPSHNHDYSLWCHWALISTLLFLVSLLPTIPTPTTALSSHFVTIIKLRSACCSLILLTLKRNFEEKVHFMARRDTGWYGEDDGGYFLNFPFHGWLKVISSSSLSSLLLSLQSQPYHHHLPSTCFKKQFNTITHSFPHFHIFRLNSYSLWPSPASSLSPMSKI